MARLAEHVKYNGKAEPAQQLRVAANQAWWEYIPSRVASLRRRLSSVRPHTVSTAAPIERFDAVDSGDEPNNLAAIGSMTAYRSLHSAGTWS